MSKLALLGGPKTRSIPFDPYQPIGKEEKSAVARVLDRGVLSKYLGCWGEDFLGGPEVQALEKEWSAHFGCKHSVAVNSNSSGLHAALGAVGVGPGDEVIVTPYSITVSASAPLVWNAIPVFADIDRVTLGLDPKSIAQKITPKTKAIVVVHLFGCPADMDEIMAIAKPRGIAVIEDCAQSPGATYKGRQTGLIGDIGVFSLNYHKHIHTGEGGICVTNNDALALRMQMIRNHAEAVVADAMEERGPLDLTNLIGFNFRLTELQAAIGREQLKKLSPEVQVRQAMAAEYCKAINGISFLSAPEKEDRKAAYYGQGFRFDQNAAGISRTKFLEALCAELMPVTTRENEGVPIYGGYVKPIYLQPMFQKRAAYKGGYPFTGTEAYQKGVCPVTEKLYESELWLHDLTRSPLTKKDSKDVIDAIHKVAENIEDLRA